MDDAFCVPDESYVGTVVHSHLDNASDVDGNITMLRLNTGGGFDAASISEEFLLEIRGSVTTSGPASRGNGGVGQQDWHGQCKDATLRWPHGYRWCHVKARLSAWGVRFALHHQPFCSYILKVSQCHLYDFS